MISRVPLLSHKKHLRLLLAEPHRGVSYLSIGFPQAGIALPYTGSRSLGRVLLISESALDVLEANIMRSMCRPWS